ncbi:type I-D CRISPR-associated protein Cas7/Csc2 [Candidatus Methanocrinis natronophilus]|uniref:Type I-D CRISPR-associated protein Cas7/Csc2 n=1 Tax=Candidatus Methanocrinis natronophilus TaxID=3033396 RepID=A0ABT5X6C9_9EURY|nr:type I-D CRISPR-associated protein Cas7/Csc2 [Candidatus Methanocrinis natronophilus]MDF0590157.1 type I-D CRISPR-associated protein Cas7/Csc2 [Candidatus Methanocrinis natronophilus]
MSIEDIKKKLSSSLVEQLINEPSAHYVHILLLRELQSSAIFTTNGQDADIATVGIGAEDGLVDYSPVMMFKRKQTGSDRRKGKELQRNLTGIEDTMNVNEMTQDSPESILYGSAAGEEAISVTSRVMYDTAYSIRDSSAIVEEKFQNAPGDQFAKGATTAIREPDFIVPGTVFPCVVTLRDATFNELVFVLGITKMNKRYGAATSRIGRIENHVLGIYYGIEEGPANLILSQEVARRLAMENGGMTSESLNKVLYSPVLDIAKVKKHVKKAFDDDIEDLNVEALTDEETDKLLGYVTSESLKESLERQRVLSSQFFEEVNGEKKGRGKK